MKRVIVALVGLIGLVGCSSPIFGEDCDAPEGDVVYRLQLTERPGGTCIMDQSHIPEQTWSDGTYVYDPACKAAGQRRKDACWWKLRVECPEWSWEQTVDWADDWSSATGVIEYESDKCRSTYDVVMIRQ